MVDIARELGRLANASEETSRQLESLARKLEHSLEQHGSRLDLVERDMHAARTLGRVSMAFMLGMAGLAAWVWDHMGAVR